jgi:protoporphyrinogen oxidase
MMVSMKKITTETLIIGAGPAGLAAAMELSKAGKDFILVEKSDRVGGLSKTYEFKEGDLVFRTDNGPHRFFSKNPYLYEFIEGLLDEKWIVVKRQTRQFIDGKFYDYPVNAVQALRNLGLFRTAHIMFDYGIAKIKYSIFRKPVDNFADYVYANFGKSLGRFNMINYTEKIWGMPSEEIHIDWAGQRIKGLSITSLAKDALLKIFKKKSKDQPKTLIDTFYYPELGTGLIYETIKDRLLEKGYKIFLSTYPKKILHANRTVKKVVCASPEGPIEIECKNLIESVPLKHFLDLLDQAPAEHIKNAQKKLRYRSQVYLFITLDKETVTADQWIYFPNTEIPIGRMSEMRNFSPLMSPPGKTSLFLEFFCTAGDAVWNMSEAELLDYALVHLEKMKFIRRDEVRKAYRMREENVYPIYDLSYKEYLETMKRYLDKFENLYYIGRPGRFRYNNQDHSLEMGILAAKSVIEGKRYDIEGVGMEKEYYESGNVRTHANSKQ